jgi:hypothetical protein
MAFPEEEQNYSPLQAGYADLEDDSDTTLQSTCSLGKRLKRPRRRYRPSNFECAWLWFRWGSVIVLQSIILFLVLQNKSPHSKSGWVEEDTETGGDINGLYIPSERISRLHKVPKRLIRYHSASHKYTLLQPNESAFVPDMTSNANRMEVRRNWDQLMPRK